MALAASADSVNTTNEPGRSYLGPARLSGQKKVYVKKTVLPNTSADTFHDHKYIRTNSPHNAFFYQILELLLHLSSSLLW